MIIIIPEKVQKEVGNAGLKIDFYYLKDKNKPANAENIVFIKSGNNDDWYKAINLRKVNAHEYANLMLNNISISITNDYGVDEDDLYSHYAMMIECEKYRED